MYTFSKLNGSEIQLKQYVVQHLKFNLNGPCVAIYFGKNFLSSDLVTQWLLALGKDYNTLFGLEKLTSGRFVLNMNLLISFTIFTKFVPFDLTEIEIHSKWNHNFHYWNLENRYASNIINRIEHNVTCCPEVYDSGKNWTHCETCHRQHQINEKDLSKYEQYPKEFILNLDKEKSLVIICPYYKQVNYNAVFKMPLSKLQNLTFDELYLFPTQCTEDRDINLI